MPIFSRYSYYYFTTPSCLHTLNTVTIIYHCFNYELRNMLSLICPRLPQLTYKISPSVMAIHVLYVLIVQEYMYDVQCTLYIHHPIASDIIVLLFLLQPIDCFIQNFSLNVHVRTHSTEYIHMYVYNSAAPCYM